MGSGPNCPGPNCPPPKSGKLGPGARLSGAQLSAANWAPDSWAPGPSCPGPNCPPPKSGKLGPGQLGPGARLSGAQLSALKKCQIGPRTVGPQKFTFPKTKKSKHVIEIANSYVFPYIKYVTQHTKYTSKTQTVSVQIPNNHPKSHKHLKKCQKYHLNHKISTPKIEMSFKISNSLSKISDEPSKIQNNPPQSQRPHQKYNVHHPNY